MTFYDFPAQHWGHLRTTNLIKSTFATVRLRHRRTKRQRFTASVPGDGLQVVCQRTAKMADSEWCKTAAGRDCRSAFCEWRKARADCRLITGSLTTSDNSSAHLCGHNPNPRLSHQGLILPSEQIVSKKACMCRVLGLMPLEYGYADTTPRPAWSRWPCRALSLIHI